MIQLITNYLLMGEPASVYNNSSDSGASGGISNSSNIDSCSIDSCKHKIIRIYMPEWVCERCGRVFSDEEAEALERGSREAIVVRSAGEAGLDPHGKTPLWHVGLGSLEGNGWVGVEGGGEGRGGRRRTGGKRGRTGKVRDYTSMLSNIADKLQLPSYAMLEFADLYRSFVKGEKDKVVACKLALLLLAERYEEVKARIKRLAEQDFGSDTPIACIEYITTIVENQFQINEARVNANLIRVSRSLAKIARLARKRGAYNALYYYSLEVI